MKIKLYEGGYVLFGYCTGLIANSIFQATIRQSIDTTLILIALAITFKLIDKIIDGMLEK